MFRGFDLDCFEYVKKIQNHQQISLEIIWPSIETALLNVDVKQGDHNSLNGNKVQ